MLVWVNTCTGEVLNCRRIAAINEVILTENPDNEESASSRLPAARDVTLKDKKCLEQEPQSLKIEFCLLFRAHEMFQMMLTQTFLEEKVKSPNQE